MTSNCNPLDDETAFGDPEAHEKAAARMKLHDFCEKEKMHCPWAKRCGSDPDWICPLIYEQINKGGVE